MKRHATLKTISESLGFSELKTKQQIESYSNNINLLANILLLTNELSNDFDIIKMHNKAALESQHKLHPIKAFLYNDNFYKINDIDKGCIAYDQSDLRILFPDAYIILSPEAKSAVMQAAPFIEKLNDSKNFILNNDSGRRLYSFINHLEKSNNNELLLIAKWCKNYIAEHQRSIALRQPATILINLIKFMMQNGNTTNSPMALFIPNIISNGKTEDIFKSWSNDLYPFITTNLPHVIDILKTLEYTLEKTNMMNEKAEILNCHDGAVVQSLLEKVTESVHENKENYQQLYGRLVQELQRFLQDKKCKFRLELIKNYNKVILPLAAQSSSLPTTIFVKQEIVTRDYDDYDNDWLSSVKQFEYANKQIEKQQQKAIQQREAARNQKRKIRNKQKEKERENEIKEEDKQSQSIKHHYDYRVLRWFFDEDFIVRNNFDSDKLLKHTFDFACDGYIFTYGIRQDWLNKTNPGQIDDVYYMGGEIIYPTGKKETVLFACCKDPAGTCYHRGIEKKPSELFDEFKGSKFNYDYPSYYEPKPEEHSVEYVIDDTLYSKECIENNFYVSIKDNRNKVTLILFKPTFNKNN